MSYERDEYVANGDKTELHLPPDNVDIAGKFFGLPWTELFLVHFLLVLFSSWGCNNAGKSLPQAPIAVSMKSGLKGRRGC